MNNTLSDGTLLHGGRYTISGVISRGAFGVVYTAHTKNGDTVAIKELLPEGVERKRKTLLGFELPWSSNRVRVESAPEWAAFLARFESEANTLAALRHESIVRIHDAFAENDTAYLVMEYLDGITAQEWIDTGRKPVPGFATGVDALQIVRAVARALEHAHSRGVVHRDVKPANIMLSGGRVVLVDFGISKDYLTDVARSQAGTPAYMAHEQMAGTKQGPPADVYGLAATAYHLFSGRLPVPAFERVRAINANRPDPLQPLASVSDAVRAALANGLAIDPAKRTQTVSQFLAQLEGRAATGGGTGCAAFVGALVAAGSALAATVLLALR